MLDRDDPNKVFPLDLETGKVVAEWVCLMVSERASGSCKGVFLNDCIGRNHPNVCQLLYRQEGNGDIISLDGLDYILVTLPHGKSVSPRDLVFLDRTWTGMRC